MTNTPTITETMSPRAKTYLIVRAIFFLVLAVLCVIFPAFLTTAPYTVFIDVIPHAYQSTAALVSLGAISGFTALILTVSAFRGKEGLARLAIFWAAGTSALWLGGYVSAIIISAASFPLALLLWVNLIAIDLIMLRRPLTTPFEDLLGYFSEDNDSVD